MTGQDIKKLISALHMSPISFSKRTTIPLPKLKRILNKDKLKVITDENVLNRVYVGGLQLVAEYGKHLAEQAHNLEKFQPMFEELEGHMQARAKDKKFKERFEGGDDQ